MQLDTDARLMQRMGKLEARCQALEVREIAINLAWIAVLGLAVIWLAGYKAGALHET